MKKWLTLISRNCKRCCEQYCGCQEVICVSDTDGDHDFDAKESNDEFNSNSLVHTNKTFDYQMADEDLDIEDHFDERDFIRD